ncbi:MAG: VWA domain-containing protein [Chloroflexi bacterium]|nr:VWA domain-containing protein [Chloroflexota bacterium]
MKPTVLACPPSAWKSLRWGLAVCTFLLASLMTHITAKADGFIIPIPPPHIQVVPDLAVKYHHVRVTIKDQVAQTEIDQVFLNDSPYELEGTYLFPLPEDAAISDFALFVDGKRLSGKVLDKEEARRTYESIVRRRRDPALLEYVGRNAFQASIYPIPAHGEKRVQIAYRQVLLADRGLVHYVYPLDTERFSSRPLEEVVITVDLQSPVPIKAIYSPSHNVAIERTGETSALISFEANNVRPDKDFELYYSISEDDVGVHLLSYKERGEDGFFLLLIAPQVEADVEAIVAKDVLFVLDTSGSMEGKKLQQAKDALEFVLDHLQEEDRFNIIAFNTSISKYATNLRPASERDEARRFVRRLSAGGGTNIHRALLEAMDSNSERPLFIIFLTDGLPTAGVTDLERILTDVNRVATKNIRLFSFGVGYDVNTILLDTLSQEHRGASAYVEPEQSIEEVITSFYTKISAPLLSDLRLYIRGVEVEDLYPDPLPDLFAGSQLLVVGRYREGGSAQVTLHGTVNGEERSFSYPNLNFSRQGGQDFVPRLWATRKIGYLLKEIRLHGENKELVDSIISLSVRYGIMTPYTSFLVDEQQDILTEAGRQLVAESSRLTTLRSMPAFGAQAVADSQIQNKLTQAERGSESEAAEIKLVGNKTFVLRNNIWTDTAYDPQRMRVTRLQFGSPAYFQLLAKHPQWGKYFAIGGRLIVVLDGTAYQIESDAIETQGVSVPNSPVLSPWEQFWQWFCSITGR